MRKGQYIFAVSVSLLMICAAATWPEVQAQEPRQTLSAEGAAALQQIIDSAHHPDLVWPDFLPLQAEVKDFYVRTNSTLAWVQDGKPSLQAATIVGLLIQSDDKGLVPEDYDASRWPARLQKLQSSPSDSDLARFDAAVTVSAMRYIRALHVGRVNPKTVGLELDISGLKFNLAEFLHDKVIFAEDPTAAVKSVEPAFPGYLRTLDALHRYRIFARTSTDGGKLMSVPAWPIEPGGVYADLPQLTYLLQLVGDLPPDARVDTSSTAYEGAVVEAVKHFQLRHGKLADGYLRAELINEMNIPLAQRVRQIELTLERWRWLEHSFSQPPVVVNLPEFRLRAYDDQYQIAFYETVIVGKAYEHKSPVFEKQIEYVVFRPYWNVTPSIQRAEIVPHIERDRNYIAAKNFEVVKGDDEVVTDGPISDDVLAQLKAGRLRVRQKPGPTNSLGLVKLIFPNPDNVYLHGTDAPQLFSDEVRDLSHGCIRVQKPSDLAAWALRHNPGWNPERVQAAMNGTQNNMRVDLAKPIPVLIVYGTVAVDEKINVFFFDDIYGYDKELDEVLKKGYPYPSS